MGARALLLLRLLLLALLPLGPAALLPDPCPGCTRPRPADVIRLEAIKLQILTKLGLKSKPNVKRTLPHELVQASLKRAREEDEPGNSIGAGSGHMGMTSGSGDPTDPDEDHMGTTDAYSDYDEFYGRTSEIITFAEQDNGSIRWEESICKNGVLPNLDTTLFPGPLPPYISIHELGFRISGRAFLNVEGFIQFFIMQRSLIDQPTFLDKNKLNPNKLTIEKLRRLITS